MASLRRPRLLFLCQTLPYPADGGVWIRTFHVLRLLARAFDVKALCFERSATSGAAADWTRATGPEGLGRFADVEVFAIPQKHSRLRFVWDHLRSMATARVYTTFLYDSVELRARLASLVRSGEFDLVHVDSLDLASYLPFCAGIPVVCVHHDVESALLRRRAAVEASWWRKRYLRVQSRLMEKVERQWCGRIALNVTVSEQDGARLQSLVPAARIAVIPNGVDTSEFFPDASAAHLNRIAYVGGTNPFPNLDALTFFCEDILPHVNSHRPVLTRWIGRSSAEQQEQYRQRFGVELTGYVEDPRGFMQQAACHIVPLRVGGGTRLKILNAWAMGKPVVSTSIGCEGLAAVDGDNVLIRDAPRDFAAAVCSVLNDPALARRLGMSGRRTVERLYSWDIVGEGLIDRYLGVLRRAPAGASESAVICNAEPRFDHA